jgi:hypothetical protein
MEIALKEIHFCHTPGAAEGGSSLMLKRKGHTVVSPEWPSPEGISLALYAVKLHSGSITIKARFQRQDKTDATVKVRAFSCGRSKKPRWNSIFRSIRETEIRFTHGESGLVLLKVTSGRLKKAGIYKVHWRWEYEDNNGRWHEFEVSRHKFYVILDTPQAPWTMDEKEGTNELPWGEALAFACKWAEKAKTPEEAVKRITKYVYEELGKPRAITLDKPGGGRAAYCNSLKYNRGYMHIDGDFFDCEKFIWFLCGSRGNGRYVNCQDCASIIATFSNILGCRLVNYVISGSNGLKFPIKKVLPIGYSPDSDSSLPTHFQMHEIACFEGNVSDDEKGIFDACLKLWSTETPVLVANTLFGKYGETGKYYNELVKDNTAVTLKKHDTCVRPLKTTRVRREYTRYFSRRFINYLAIDEWKLKENVPYHRLDKENLFTGELYYTGRNPRQCIMVKYVLFPPIGKATKSDPATLEGSVKALVNAGPESDIDINTFLTGLVESGMMPLEKVAETELEKGTGRKLVIPPRDLTPIGEAAYTGDNVSKEYILFKRSKVVLEIRSIGEESTDVFDFAKKLDTKIRRLFLV